MTEHDAIRDLVAAVALGAASEQEIVDVERHAATCAECRSELDALRAATAGLALDVPQLDPPAQLKKRVMDTVREDASRRPRSPAPARRRRFAVWPSLAGALAAAVVGLFAWNVTLRGGEPDGRTIPFAGQAQAPQVRGTVTVRDDGTAVMRIDGLPVLDPDKSYELWSIRDGTPRSEGFAGRTADGQVIVATADVGSATALAVTAELRTNTGAPTQEPLIVVPLTG